jgi:hypothetical protein
MKLVNPSGRDVKSFETEANYQTECHWYCNDDSNIGQQSAYTHVCGCECIGTDNYNANFSVADSQWW